MKNFIFFICLPLFGQSFTQLDVRPKQNGDQGLFRLFEKRVNGNNFSSIIAADSIVTNTIWKWPAADSAGCFSSDGAGNMSLTACSGAGSFVTTNTAQATLTGTKSWDSLHTFNTGVAIKLGSSARYWGPETDVTYDLGTSSFRWSNVWGHYFGTKAGTFEVQNSLGTVSRAAMTQAGFAYYDTAGVAVNTMLISGFNTTSGYNVSGLNVIDGSRNITAGFILGTGATIAGNLTVTGTCTGCVSSTAITTNTTQTGLTGDKQIDNGNTWVWGGATNLRVTIASTGIYNYNSINALRVALNNTGSSSTSRGKLLLYTGNTGVETIYAGVDGSGFFFDTSYGVTQTFSVRNSTNTGSCSIVVEGGIVKSTTC